MIDPLLLPLLAVAGLAGYGYRADFEKYSLFTAGVFERVTHHETARDKQCFDCQTEIDTGERRTYHREIVVGGMPVVRYGHGHTYYCEQHTSFELAHGDKGSTDTNRLSKTVIEGLLNFTMWVFDKDMQFTEEDSEFADTEFDDVMSSVGTAVNLLPMAVLIFTAALGIHFVSALQGEL